VLLFNLGGLFCLAAGRTYGSHKVTSNMGLYNNHGTSRRMFKVQALPSLINDPR
jgi:hypothetical protein